MPISTLFNIFLMILGFGLVIAIHELGHFLAAKWAGVRVHAFAIGFGTAVCTWRKGLGFRWGSSESEYNRLLSSLQAHKSSSPQALPSPTEYRLNWFPFGGYVKMLGQDDLNAATGAAAPDSFVAKPVWKRMVIISGGVVMNLILAGALFIAAYTHGLVEVAPIIGDVRAGSPAEKAGFLPGDRVLSAGHERVEAFTDLMLATAMSGKNEPLPVTIVRDAEPKPIMLTPVAQFGDLGLLEIGALPAPSDSLFSEKELAGPRDEQLYARQLARLGMGALTPGMRLSAIDGAPLPPHDPNKSGAFVPTAVPLRRALEAARGERVTATFTDPESRREETVTLRAEPSLQLATVKFGEDTRAFQHLLGLTPVMSVLETDPRGEKAGLLPGDVFARIGPVEWPSVAAGITQIRAARGKSIELVVLRDGALVLLNAPVDSAGTIGFSFTDTAATTTQLAAFPPSSTTPPSGTGFQPVSTTSTSSSPQASSPQATSPSPPAARLLPAILPGSRITSVETTPVASLHDVRAALLSITTPSAPARISLTLETPARPQSPAAPEGITLDLTPDDTRVLHALGWDASTILSAFTVAQFEDRATGPMNAINKGVHRTKKVIIMTYLTFLRLFQGTVPVDQLQGPVGITHAGTRIAERGFIYLIFFLGLISANLAVINFLPLPITDGGQMVFLAIEGVTRKPVSPGIQNAAIIAGLVLIGTVFIVVTFNDLVRLLG